MRLFLDLADQVQVWFFIAGRVAKSTKPRSRVIDLYIFFANGFDNAFLQGCHAVRLRLCL